MEFTNKFFVALPLQEAWALMLDVPRIMPCLPGARLTGVEGDRKYLGEVTVRLGPIKLAFEGQAEMVRQDDATHTAWLRGRGLDPKGRGAAESEFSFALVPRDDGTEVTVTTQLQLSGAVAQYGRGSGMIADVAGHILGQFERNLAQMLLDEQLDALPLAGSAAGAAPAALAEATPGVGAGATSASSPQDAAAVLAEARAVLALAQRILAEVRSLHGATRGKAQPKELNALGIGMRAFWNNLFKRKG